MTQASTFNFLPIVFIAVIIAIAVISLILIRKFGKNGNAAENRLLIVLLLCVLIAGIIGCVGMFMSHSTQQAAAVTTVKPAVALTPVPTPVPTAAPTAVPTRVPTATPVPVDITSGYAAPFKNIRWNATYDTMKGLGMEAYTRNDGRISFSLPGIKTASYAGGNYLVDYIFENEKLAEVVGTQMVGDNNNYEVFLSTLSALENSYGGEFSTHNQWKDEAAKINNTVPSSEAIARHDVKCVATMKTRVATVTVIVEGVHNKVINCGIQIQIRRNNPVISDSSLPVGLIK